MPEHLHSTMRLLVVSDTAMCKRGADNYAFGPVVKELEYLLPHLTEVVWIGFNRMDRIADPSLLKVPSDIKVIMLTRTGGPGLIHKLKILLYLPIMVFSILPHVLRADV